MFLQIRKERNKRLYFYYYISKKVKKKLRNIQVQFSLEEVFVQI